jgi:hypothetical protein
MSLMNEYHGVADEELQKHVQEESANLIDPALLDKWYSTSYQDSAEIASSKLLKHLLRKLNIQDKRNDAFKHALISGDEII